MLFRLTISIKDKKHNPALRDHKLIGNYKGRRECHLAGDWLLIYKLGGNKVIFERTGSHSELIVSFDTIPHPKSSGSAMTKLSEHRDATACIAKI